MQTPDSPYNQRVIEFRLIYCNRSLFNNNGSCQKIIITLPYSIGSSYFSLWHRLYNIAMVDVKRQRISVWHLQSAMSDMRQKTEKNLSDNDFHRNRINNKNGFVKLYPWSPSYIINEISILRVVTSSELDFSKRHRYCFLDRSVIENYEHLIETTNQNYRYVEPSASV